MHYSGDQIQDYDVKGASYLPKMMRGAHKIVVVEAEEHRLLGKPKCRWKNNIKN